MGWGLRKDRDPKNGEEGADLRHFVRVNRMWGWVGGAKVTEVCRCCNLNVRSYSNMSNPLPSSYWVTRPNLIYPSYPEGPTSCMCDAHHGSFIPKCQELGWGSLQGEFEGWGDGSPDFLFSTRKCPADEVSGSCRSSSLPSPIFISKSYSEWCTQWWLGSRVRKSEMGTGDIQGTG